MLNILASFAQFERSLIAERVRAGMERARRQGKHVGRPAALNGDLDALRPAIEAGTLSRRQAAKRLGVTVSTVSRTLSRKGGRQGAVQSRANFRGSQRDRGDYPFAQVGPDSGIILMGVNRQTFSSSVHSPRYLCPLWRITNQLYEEIVRPIVARCATAQQDKRGRWLWRIGYLFRYFRPSARKWLTRSRRSRARPRQNPQWALAQALREIQPDTENLCDSGLITANIADRLPLPYMVFLALLLGTKCKFAIRPYEKTAWIYCTIYKGIPMRLEHGKFGMRLATPATTDPAVVDGFIGVLVRSFPTVDRALEPLVTQQARVGNLTIPSLFHKLDSKYRFFRERAEKAYGAHVAHEESEFKRMIEDMGKVVQSGSAKAKQGGMTYHPMERMWEGFYYGSAAIDTYFSLFEYLMIVTLAFTTFDPTRMDLLELIGSSWKTKMKTALDLSSNPEAKNLYDSLLEIKGRYRDPLAHGGLDRDGGTLYVHIPKFGAVPILLSKYEDSLHYSSVPVTDVSFRDACQVFDRVDEYLQRHTPERYAYKWARYGMQVAFDKASLTELRGAATSDEAFEEYLAMTSHFVDEATNMDW